MAVTRRPLPPEPIPAIDPRLDSPVALLRLHPRTVNLLERAGVLYVRELLDRCGARPERCDCGGRHLLAVPNIGETTLEEIYAALAEIGFERNEARP